MVCPCRATCPTHINYLFSAVVFYSFVKLSYSLLTQLIKTSVIHIHSFCFVSKVLHVICLALEFEQRGTGHFAFVSTALLSGSLACCLPGSSLLFGQTDNDDDSHQGCSSLQPVHPTVRARGAGAENREQRGSSE